MSLAVFSAASTLLALDPNKQIGQYGHESWTLQRGLPGEAVYQVLQSKDGYLWVRTGAGLARFDGVRFVSMDAEIGTEPVRAICMSWDGELLIRTATRTILYKDGRFTDYLPQGKWSGELIRVIFQSSDRSVFVGTDDSIFLLQANGEPKALLHRTGWVNAFLEDHTGKIWIASSTALYSYRDKKLSPPFDIERLTSGIRSLIEDRQHRIWVGSGKGLYRLTDTGASILLSQQAGMPPTETQLLEDAQGNLWAGTETSGLVRLTNGKASSLDHTDGLTDNGVLSLLVDREGDLWIGTTGGLDRLRDTQLTTYSIREGLTSDRTRSALVTRDGTLNILGNNGGLTRISNGIAKPFEHNAMFPSAAGQAQFEGKDGSLWLGMWKGLCRIQAGRVTVYSGDGRFSGHFISAISEDDESLIVATAESEAFRFKNGKVLPFTVRGRPTPLTGSGAYIFTIYNDPSGTLWFGTTSGLLKIPNSVSEKAGWMGKIDFHVTSIFDDGHGILWLGGRTAGIVQFRIADGRVTHFTGQQGLFDSFASHILAGDDGNLWISTKDGIFSVSLKDLTAVADGRGTWVSTRKYGFDDGMKTTEATDASSQPGGARTPDGRLWFTTKKGIVVIDPTHIPHNGLIPPVIVESIAADGAVQPQRTQIKITPGVKAIEIHYTALSLRIPERVRFRYRLDGYDRTWVDAGTRRVAYYTNLPPGSYTFHVIAANDDGLWNQIGDSTTIALEPRFYQTKLFKIGCLILVIILAIAANRFNTRLIRNRAVQLNRLVEERTAELKTSQGELRQLAHFDALTALPNRRVFTEDFARMCSQSGSNRFSLLLIDFDRFKAINDSFGHDAGDAFLIEASRRLASAIRSSDVVARLGGDEFAILLSGSHDQDGIERICDRIVMSFSSAVDFKGINILTSVSVGVATFPDHGKTQEELYKSADLALYEAKHRGRNKWLWYSPASEEKQLSLHV